MYAFPALFSSKSRTQHDQEGLQTPVDILRDQAALIDCSHDALFVHSIDGETLLWNQGAERMYGWSKAEAHGANIHKLLDTNSFEPLQEILKTLEQTGHWEGELQRKSKNCQIILVHSRWALGRGSNGFPEKILVIDRDITEQWSANASLRESEDLYRDLVEHSHDLICTH